MRYIYFTLLFALTVTFQPQAFAQRAIGGQVLALDDGHGHIVDITVPTMTGPGPYSWTLPITPGGSALTLPTPTVAGSMLYSNGINSWMENTNVTATNLGILTANTFVPTSGNISAPSSTGGGGTNLTLTAGNSGGTAFGGNATLQAGSSINGGGIAGVNGGNGLSSIAGGGSAEVTGGTGAAAGGTVYITGGSGSGGSSGPGGNVNIGGGFGGTGATPGAGGSVNIFGGSAGTNGASGGSISFSTTTGNAVASQRMTITPAGSVEIGSSNQFTVDNAGNVSTTGNTTLSGGLSVGVNVQSGSWIPLSNDHVIILTTSGQGVILPFPTAGRILTIINASSGTITLYAATANTISGAYFNQVFSITLSPAGSGSLTTPTTITVVGNGTNNWWVLSEG